MTLSLTDPVKDELTVIVSTYFWTLSSIRQYVYPHASATLSSDHSSVLRFKIWSSGSMV